MDLRFRPIQKWPDGWARDDGEGQWSHFKAPWSDTLQLLDRELSHLGAEEATIQLDAPEHSIRASGALRGDAKVIANTGNGS